MHKILNFSSKHFELLPLAESIFAAIAENGGHAISNSGLIDLGGQIVVFDTFLTPQAALELRRFSTEKFGQAPQIVINSHYHNDHIWGNQVFAADAKIISSTRTRELIATAGMEEFQWYSSNSAQRLEALRAQYQNTNDEQVQKELFLWIGEYEGVVEAMPHLTVCMPSITFDGYFEIHGDKHMARFINFEGGHTSSDTVLFLPQEGIVFMGDLLFVGCHPYLADGDPLKLLQALQEISQFEATCYVPGHGPIGTTEDLKQLIAYIEQCIETAQMLVETGNVNEDRIKELKVAEIFQHWQMPQFYQSNIHFLCDRLSQAKGGKKTA